MVDDVRLWEDDYFEVCVDPTRRVLIARRKRGPGLSVEALKAWSSRLIEEYSNFGYSPREAGLVIDAREAVGKSDPEFEQALVEDRKVLHAHFCAVVNLVRTTVGRMQHDRLHQRAGSFVTDDELEARELACDRASISRDAS